MNNSESSSGGGIGCLGALSVMLTILFVGLKLGAVIEWHWLLVISPLLIYISLRLIFTLGVWALLLGVGAAVGAIAGGFVLFVNRAEKKSEKKTMKEVKDWKENN
jgi:nitrate reductase gamma subunit